MTKDSESFGERRDFYRVTDNLAFSFELMPADFDIPVDHIYPEEKSVGHRLLGDLRRMDADNQSILTNIKDRDTKSYLEIMNRKIGLIARYVAAHVSSQNMRFEPVNISGGGMQFASDAPIELNRVLLIEILLYPSCDHINCYATVVNSLKTKDATHYEISVRFTQIREADRDRLVKHVLQRQASQIREKNAENEP